MVAPAKKKLLVLDVNGLLLDTYFKNEKLPICCRADGKVNKHYVYRRPYCNEFIEFCFENFELGIWSSSKKHNVDGFINFIFGDLKNKLLFSWNQAECTDTGLRVPGKRYKPVFLKELSKLWDKVKPDLPWEKGDYGPSNTLLIDDSPYKALRNPPYTAVFPNSYKVSNNFDDSLGGALRKYLEGLSSASNVQHYVKHHPFGQPPISKESSHWSFYRTILLPMGDSAPYMEEEENDMVNAVIPNLERSIPFENREASLHSGNGQHSESITCIGKRKKKRRDRPVASTDQSPGLGMEEDNGVVNVAMPNMEMSISSENKKVNLQSGNGQQSESSSQSSKRKKRGRDRLGSSTNQSSVPGMEEENGVVNMATLNMEKSISLENRKVNLQSGNGQQSESSLRSGKRKKRHRDHLGTSTNQSSVPGMEEENGIVNVAMLNIEKSIYSENRKVNLQSGNGQQSESSLQSGKRKKRHRDSLRTSTNQPSVPGMEEENSVVNVAMLNMEKSISLENTKVNLQSGTGQQSESSSRSGKRKKSHRDCLGTSTNQSSVPGMEEENSVVNVAMLNMEKSISLDNTKVNLQSGNEQKSESSSRIGNRKKRQRDCLFNGTTEASFRQAHEDCDVPFKNKAMAAQTDKDHCGNKPYTGRKFRDHNDFRYGNKDHDYNKPAHFSPNSHMNSNRWSSSHSQISKHGDSQASYFPRRQFQAERGHKNGVDPSIHSNVAEGGNEQKSESSSRIGNQKKRQRDCLFNGTTEASFRQAHEDCDVPFKNKAMAAQTDKDHCGNKPYTGRKFRDHNDFRYGNKDHHYNKPAHFSPNSHMNSNRWSSSHSQRSNHGDSQASYFPGRQFQAEQGHKNGVDPSIHSNVGEGGVYTNSMYSRNAVDTNFPSHQLEGYINDGQDQWHMHYATPCQSYNPSHIGYPVFQSDNPNQGTTEFRGPVMQHQFPNSQTHEQMRATHYSTQYQGHDRNFHHCKNNSRNKHGGRR